MGYGEVSIDNTCRAAKKAMGPKTAASTRPIYIPISFLHFQPLQQHHLLKAQ